MNTTPRLSLQLPSLVGVAVTTILRRGVLHRREFEVESLLWARLAHNTFIKNCHRAMIVLAEHTNLTSHAPIPRQRLEPSFNPVDGSKEFVHRDLSGNSCSLRLRRAGSRGRSARTLARTARHFFLLSLAGVFGSSQVIAAESVTALPNVFAAALIDGVSSAPAPQRSAAMARTLQAMQAESGSSEPISIVAIRVVKFAEQPRCGRVRFVLAQPASKRVWPAMGGQMNVCEDGQPPLRTCPELSGVLVPANAACLGGKPPIDTPEIAAAIRAAVAAGGITQEQAVHEWVKRLNSQAHGAAAGGASAPAVLVPGKGTK